jgi:thiamine kinase-like enzyme
VVELDQIVQQLEAELGPAEGEPRPLDGGITNCNYRLVMGGTEYVIRQPGKDTALLGIDRLDERLASEQAADLGIGPRVAAHLDDCLVTHFIACSSLSMQELADDIEQIAVALRSFHDSTLRLSGRFRISELLLAYAHLVRERGDSPPADYELALDVSVRIERALPWPQQRPCHNDLLAANLIRADGDGRIMIVDWEYAAMGDPRFDLGNVAVNNDFDDDTEDRMLRAYDGEPPSDARRAALKAMRVLSDAREAAWGVVQGSVSELDFDFAGYAGEHFARLRETVASPAFADWLATGAAGARAAQ